MAENKAQVSKGIEILANEFRKAKDGSSQWTNTPFYMIRSAMLQAGVVDDYMDPIAYQIIKAQDAFILKFTERKDILEEADAALKQVSK